MRLYYEPFRNDRLKLNLWDFLRLLVGFNIKTPGLWVGLWRTPK